MWFVKNKVIFNMFKYSKNSIEDKDRKYLGHIDILSFFYE